MNIRIGITIGSCPKLLLTGTVSITMTVGVTFSNNETDLGPPNCKGLLFFFTEEESMGYFMQAAEYSRAAQLTNSKFKIQYN